MEMLIALIYLKKFICSSGKYSYTMYGKDSRNPLSITGCNLKGNGKTSGDEHLRLNKKSSTFMKKQKSMGNAAPESDIMQTPQCDE